MRLLFLHFLTPGDSEHMWVDFAFQLWFTGRLGPRRLCAVRHHVTPLAWTLVITRTQLQHNMELVLKLQRIAYMYSKTQDLYTLYCNTYLTDIIYFSYQYEDFIFHCSEKYRQTVKYKFISRWSIKENGILFSVATLFVHIIHINLSDFKFND